jgi:hypothetical protein
MKRRDVLKFGATMAAIPAAGAAQTTPPPRNPSPPVWNPSFFNQHQNDTVVAVTDLLIPATETPGAKDALVNRYIDKILAASDHPAQNEFAHDLDALDVFSRQSAGDDFVRLTPDQQRAVLEKMMTNAQRPSFDRLKGWTSRIYYATRPGFEELNKGGRVPATFACKPA